MILRHELREAVLPGESSIYRPVDAARLDFSMLGM
jgi:hypothetical protein